MVVSVSPFLETLTDNFFGYLTSAGMAELADAVDSKSAAEMHVGSSPTIGTNF